MFLNIIGIDGSGKTTLCNNLRRLKPNLKYVHSYHEPFILKPLKFAARTLFLNGTDEFADYTDYRSKKSKASQKHSFFAFIYSIIWIIDYFFQTLFKVGIPRMIGKHLIVDRYIFDAVLNASLTANLSIGTSYKLIDLLLILLPKPDLVVLIDLPEEIAFSRKTDIQSVEYLRERRNRYTEMANKYIFLTLDGTKSQNSLLNEILSKSADFRRAR